MFEALDMESRDAPPAGNSGESVPAIMTKAAYGRYRKARFGRGTPAAVTDWIKRGRIAAPALRPDGKIVCALADAQLAASRDPARVAPLAPALPEEIEEAAAIDDPADAPLLAMNGAYADSKTELLREQVRERRLKNDISEGQYVDALGVRQKTVDMARMTRDRILVVPDNIAGALVGKDEREIAALLKAALKAAFTGMIEDQTGVAE